MSIINNEKDTKDYIKNFTTTNKNLSGSFNKWRDNLGKELSFTNTKRAINTLVNNIEQTISNIDEKELQDRLVNLGKELKAILNKKPFNNE
jgi:hypothetical protein